MDEASRRFGSLTSVQRRVINALVEQSDAPLRFDGETVSADFVRWLIVSGTAREHAAGSGIRIQGVVLTDELNLAGCTIPFPIVIETSRLAGGLVLRDANLRSLRLSSSHVAQISAYGVKVEHSLICGQGVVVDDVVHLTGATIGGDLNLQGAVLRGGMGEALRGDRLRLGGSLFLNDGLRSSGRISLINARIGGNVDLRGARLKGHSGEALVADGARVSGSILADGARIVADPSGPRDIGVTGAIRFVGTRTTHLGMTLARVVRRGGYAIVGQGLQVDEEANLMGAKMRGVVDLSVASIGTLRLDGVRVSGRPFSLNLNGARISNSVWLRAVKGSGALNLVAATIGNNLEFGSHNFPHPATRLWVGDQQAVVMGDGLQVGRSVLLHKLRAHGEIRFINATIGGDMEAEEARFANPKGFALAVDGLDVAGGIHFQKRIETRGLVLLRNTRVRRFLILRGLVAPQSLDLRATTVGTLADSKSSWPPAGRLFVTNFVYEAIDDGSPVSASDRVAWLGLQRGFSPQPFDQLASVLSDRGLDEASRDVLIAKEEFRAQRVSLTWSQRLWHRLLWLVGYGHRPGRAFGYACIWVGLASCLFWWGHRAGSFTASHNPPQVFNPIIYALDTFLPIVDLGQAGSWTPSPDAGLWFAPFGYSLARWGELLRVFLWIHILAGWLASTLIVLAISGVVKS